MTVVNNFRSVQNQGDVEGNESDFESYTAVVRLVERLHRQLLEVVKYEIEQSGLEDINSVQAMLLYNIGNAELSAGELKSRGHYLGSNVSYNLKKLVKAGYVNHEKGEYDKRSVKVSLTESGVKVREQLDKLFENHVKSLKPVASVDEKMMKTAELTMSRLKRLWSDQIRYML